MDSQWSRNKSHKHLCLIISVLFLSFTQVAFLAEGRTSHKILLSVERGDVVARAMIGSRPPRCDRRCISCGRCEAVQVPAVPQDKNGIRHFPTIITSRGDDDSNYKPMSWKCKCGDVIFNP